ncbi:hypothetical protein L6452_09160 [Arctium lappa]|uniref:Uncharacterized protein n=1 Tax=Arctium lappa TaxID=4217 RepID=A0ACB9DJT8_ARCLA|nr:hypothetical protein L6452_09160 [Arctium lappa]
MLLVHLLSHGTPEDAGLIAILHQQSESRAFQEEVRAGFRNLTAKLDSISTEFQSSISSLSNRVKVLEDTCRTQVGSSKRPHNDCDDPDHHEGEKHQHLNDTTARTETSQTDIQSGNAQER